MITPVIEILTKAQKGGYAVGAFNTVNLETTQAILFAAREKKSPVIVQFTQKTMDYAGGRAIFSLIQNIAESYCPEIPVGIHLDHGKSFEVVERALEIGMTSVMYDGSRKEYIDNCTTTQKISAYCHDRGATVQAELGNVPYLGEVEILSDEDWDIYMTDPDRAGEFVTETGADALAVAIGNAHGFTRERSVADLERLEKIAKKVSVPLVLHGASDWEGDKVGQVIKCGISCFNVDTSIRLAFVDELARELRHTSEISYDLRTLLGNAQASARRAIENKMEMFGSAGRV